ncbi:phosphatase PAP2 family protein [Sphingomonas phyllosphaerae]|uniref:phosphatase PAP2 family protein n=1 Tax=Sphingomonas phyllosphaerae TaxID=257003 RepID=UPI0024136789|nr:phosphatase PAP2 family protein [Sphingomonas phyllosphaerae]
MRPPITTPLYADAVTWSVIGGLALSCVLLSQGLGFSLSPAHAVLPALGVAALVGALVIGRVRADARLVAGATSFLQMTLFTILGVVLAYLMAAASGPLWDGWLTGVDERLGFDWPAILAVADELPRPILLIAGVAYHSLVLQMVACVLVLAGTGRLERLQRTMAAAILAGGVTVLVSGLLPATGNLFDPDRYRQLWTSVAWRDHGLVLGLRDGSIRQLDLSHMTGIVSFPSYHAALAAILLWGLYPLTQLRVPAAIWAGLTILATPLFGGHYAVDVLAGLLLAIVALSVARGLATAASDRDGMRRRGRRATEAVRMSRLGGRMHGVEVIR